MATKSDKQDFKKKISALGLGDVVGVFLRTLKLLFNSVAVLVFLFGLFGAGIGIGFVVSLFDDVKIPKTEELVAKVSEVSRISTVTYSDGSLVSEVNSDLLRVPITSEEVSNYLKQAVIATEDETFETHNGVVPKAVLRAALGSVGLGSSSGGSTLTQQLIKQQLVGDAPTFTRKANEIVSALALERNMTKEEILTIYLNVSPFGRNNQGRNIAGVEAAAQGIFGKPAKDLTVPQAAFIAGLPQSPIVYSPYASDGTRKSDEDMVYGIERYQDVLFNMYRASFLTKEEYETYKAYDIKQDFIAPAPVMADTKDYLYYEVMEEAQEVMFDYLVKRDKVSENDLKNDETKASYEELAKEELSQGGYTIKSTVDQGIYAAMQSVVANYGSVLDDGNEYVETGSVLIDNATGAILGFVGGRDYATNQNNHAFDTLRSPASTIKPLLAYGIAIDQGLIGSASILSDYPTNFSSGQPIMYGSGRGTGMMNLQTAIDRSVNIPAFWTYKMMRNAGVDAKAYMDKMNYHIPMYDIESVPLGGGVEISVLTNTNAYQTLANGGVYNKHYIVESITASDGTVVYQHEAAPVQVYSKATASIMNQLLRQVVNSGYTTTFKSRLSGLNPQAASSDFVGKTGTSNEVNDVWLMLSTPRVTLGTWAGNDDNSEMYVWTGYHNNSQYVAHMVDALYNVNADMFAGKFELDSSVIASSVVASTGQRAGTTQVNGRQVTVGGAMTTSYWAKNGAPVTSYNFMVGGTDSDRAQAWNTIIGSQTPTSSSSTQRSSSTRTSTSSSANNTNQSSETQTATSEQANNETP
ncbi:TPA: penicillin-binding protein [Streptococcus suis]|uniref:penicillin-binding protein PBP1B n=1 Tax=Streptococcus suis TaxID=1307 RepID=UPI0004043DF6|nr:penicillin-binding protein PBP1B [Streptococcus suis]NQH22321.1 penicillin-binding protein [Streptococcus suis]CYV25236.1 membrane carboxypeptidase (penicillin-binding protein) [Streptococcus suis]HEL1601540.1 penicillin-binding protein [Streptococcus suis]HEL9647699.1 penicillin-binding protein [Streptococcus suis]HEM2713698.1 penicillin-binding protein [Streptococcus suis]